MTLRRPLLVALALAVVGLSACSSQGSDHDKGGGEPPLGVVKVVRSSGDLALPMQKYDLSIAQQNMVSRASYLLKRQCAERFGVQSTEPLYLTGEDNLNLARRYGNVDLDIAKRFGYSNPSVKKSDDDDRSWNPSKRELLAIRGGTTAENRTLRDSAGKSLPKGGCGVEATKKLGNWDQFTAQKMSSEGYDRALSDSRVVAVFHKWATCMAAGGYEYTSPMKALEIRWPKPADARQIATAVDDLECRQKYNVSGIWNAVEAAYEQRSIEDNPEKFLDIEKARDKFLKAAAEALD